ncbi:MAG: glycosyltransferase [Acidimicrobiales bacterium]
MIVVPCYNEEHRLDVDAMGGLANSGQVRLLFVNDGSTDGTAGVLGGIESVAPDVEVVDLPVNVGKGEAVRGGLLRAIGHGSQVVGYYDADLSTPPAELLRLVEVLGDHPSLEAVLGSRVALLGSVIERSPCRHYLGRVFASAASIALGLRVYDSQCGAKVFRATPSLSAAIERPFRSRWAFDIELLHRLLTGCGHARALPPDAFLEVPLQAWSSVGASRLTPQAALSAGAVVMSMICQRSRRALRR